MAPVAKVKTCSPEGKLLTEGWSADDGLAVFREPRDAEDHEVEEPLWDRGDIGVHQL